MTPPCGACVGSDRKENQSKIVNVEELKKEINISQEQIFMYLFFISWGIYSWL